MNKKLIISIFSVAFVMVLGFTLWLGPHNSVKADSTQPIQINTNSQQGIWVTGQGTITVAPDIAIINVGVTSTASKVSESFEQASAAMVKIMKALEDAGIAKKDIQTTNFNIQQITLKTDIIYYDKVITPVAPGSSIRPSSSSAAAVTSPDQPTPQYGYQVTNTVTVIIRDMDKVGAIIDSVAAAGGDMTRINGVSFAVEKPEQYYETARKAAMKDAQDKAQQLAQLSGVTLGKPYYISENSYNPPGVYTSARGTYYAADSVTPISSGQTQINFSVQVAYSIQ